MELKNLITNDRVIEKEHPAFDGLIVKLAYVSREKTKKLIDRSTITEFDRKSREPVEKVDNDLFLSLYVPEVVKGWKGFKYRYLSELLPVDLSSVENIDDELEYTESNAIELMKNSVDFDSWISSVTKDIKNFNKNS